MDATHAREGSLTLGGERGELLGRDARCVGGRTALDVKYRLLKSAPLLARIYTAGKVTRLMKRVDTLLARASAA